MEIMKSNHELMQSVTNKTNLFLTQLNEFLLVPSYICKNIEKYIFMFIYFPI